MIRDIHYAEVEIHKVDLLWSKVADAQVPDILLRSKKTCNAVSGGEYRIRSSSLSWSNLRCLSVECRDDLERRHRIC